MSQNNTVLGMLANVVLFSLVFQMVVYCLLLVFLSTPHTCAPVLSASAWLTGQVSRLRVALSFSLVAPEDAVQTLIMPW